MTKTKVPNSKMLNLLDFEQMLDEVNKPF